MWVFGYGSLLWKVDFPYRGSVKGYIKGYSRRFYQGSEDHRGTPQHPGRVVTLVPTKDQEEQLWGIAYEIAPQDIDNVRDHLDFREKCGYEVARVTFHPEHDTDSPFDLDLYVGSVDNPHYLGPASLDEIARHIHGSHGPSGANSEYLFNLAGAVREMLPHVYDEHLFELDRRVRDLCHRDSLPLVIKPS